MDLLICRVRLQSAPRLRFRAKHAHVRAWIRSEMASKGHLQNIPVSPLPILIDIIPKISMWRIEIFREEVDPDRHLFAKYRYLPSISRSAGEHWEKLEASPNGSIEAGSRLEREIPVSITVVSGTDTVVRAQSRPLPSGETRPTMAAKDEQDERHRARRSGIEVLPELESFDGEEWEGAANRKEGMGTASRLDDETWLLVLGHLGHRELGRLACCSKAMYAFANHQDLWKVILMEEFGGNFHFQGSWKGTFLKKMGEHTPEVSKPVHLGWFRSNLLYQSWICSNVSVDESWIEMENVDRRQRLTLDEFRQEYEIPNKPVVITDVVTKWPAVEKWSDEYLMQAFGENKVHAGGFSFDLKDYLRYMEAVSEGRVDDQPLYLFDKGFAQKAPSLLKDYTVPEYFQEDFFSFLGKERPDYRWLIVGPARSGSSFHQDPNCTNAWNAVIRGTKKWILFPPHVTPPGVHPSVDGADVATPVSLVEWFLNFYAESKELECQPYECICKEGDLLFVPRGWWHLAFNLTDAIAITQNYVNASNLKHVLRFLRSKNPELISGVEDSQRPLLATKFEEKLREAQPRLMEQLDQEDAKRQEKSAAAKRLASIFMQDDMSMDNSAPAPFRFCF